MPVFPEVASMSVPPGARSPDTSAAFMIDTALRATALRLATYEPPYRLASVRSCPDRRAGMVGTRAMAECGLGMRCLPLGGLGGWSCCLALGTAGRRSDVENLRLSKQRTRRAMGGSG